VAGLISSGVTDVVSNNNAFAALKNDGSVVVWGASSYGGSQAALPAGLDQDVVKVAGNRFGFLALKTDGTVVPWGQSFYVPNTSTLADLESAIVDVKGLDYYWVLELEDGSHLLWGWNDLLLQLGKNPTDLQAYKSSSGSLASHVVALFPDGTLKKFDINARSEDILDHEAMRTGVDRMLVTIGAIIALKKDGSVATTGDAINGGDIYGPFPQNP
jgi:hypothetical protein